MKQQKPHPKVQTIMDRARKRREAMRTFRNEGWSLARIGKHYGVSWQRVQQILEPK